MFKIYHIAYRVLLNCCLLLGGTLITSAQGKTDSATALLNSMTPEQAEMLLQSVIKQFPPEQKSKIEETLRIIHLKEPEVKTLTLPGKKVSFVPLAHACTPEFYEAGKNIVSEHKASGYRVYYEELKKAQTQTPDGVDSFHLKLRKVVGVSPNRQTYKILQKFFPNLVAQPAYKSLGVTESDLNADISVRQMIDKYEAMYGKVNLTGCDFDTRLGTLVYPCDKLKNDLTPIVVNFRNEHVAGLIRSSEDEKILVLYGARHIDGIMELLQRKQ